MVSITLGLGSETPWIEVMALRNGARHVTTVDYVKMISEDPRLSILHANDFNSMFLNNEDKSYAQWLYFIKPKFVFISKERGVLILFKNDNCLQMNKTFYKSILLTE